MRSYFYVVIAVVLFAFVANDMFAVKLQKPKSEIIYGYSGNEQTQTINKFTDNPIRVLATDKNGNPLKGTELRFEVISSPKNSENYYFKDSIVNSNDEGIAENYFHIGNMEGTYELLISSVNDCDANSLAYRVYGRKSTWVWYLIMGVLGGLAMFLYGMNQLSKGLQAVAGNKMRNLIGMFTKNRFSSFLAGMILTVVVQSSTATSVMLVSFVEAGLMSFIQTLGMLLGAGVGTTITAQLIAFKITDFSMMFIVVGFGLLLFSKNIRINNIGKSVLGFGLLFFGMYIMSDSMSPLQNYSGFISALVQLENPFVGILIGFLFTALIQSSAAFIGVMITIASQGFLSLEACIPLILGTNLGTVATAILASIGSGKESKKVAFAYTLLKLIGVLIFIWWIPEFANFVRNISPKATEGFSRFEALGETIPRQIANAHTVFSIGISIIILPVTGIIAKFINWLFHEKEDSKEDGLQLKYIKSALTSSPALSLSLAKKETERMGEIAYKMVNLCLIPFFNKKSEEVLDELQKLENESDFLRDNINKYLISIGSESADKQSLNEGFQIMYVVKELEMIGDIVNTNIRHQVQTWMSSDASFSEEGKTDLQIMQDKALKQISRSMNVFIDINLEKAERVKKKSKRYANLADEYEKAHYERLIRQNQVSAGSSKAHLELIGLFNSINRHATNISRIMLNWK